MSEEHISLNQIIQFRLEKLQKLRDAGVNPYPYNFKQTHFSSEISVIRTGRASTNLLDVVKKIIPLCTCTKSYLVTSTMIYN